VRMIWVSLLGVCSAWQSSASAELTGCDPSEVTVPIIYQFKEERYRLPWIYESLRASIATGEPRFTAKSVATLDGALNMTFCVREIAGKSLTLRVGPRVHTLVARPVQPNGQMSLVRLLDQPGPDWLVLKSVQRLEVAGASLPAYELELVNFGPEHPGGEVAFEARNTSRRCAFPTPGVAVVVNVSLAGQRFGVASADPDFPQQQVVRKADLEENFAECLGNFRLTASFGQTGKLAPGATRIRYSIQNARDVKRQRDVANLFAHQFWFTVEDAWPACRTQGCGAVVP
jgi:hypothetical protein